MCPACMASAALTAGGVITTGGLTVLAGKMFRTAKPAKTVDHVRTTEKTGRRQIQRKGEMIMATTSKTQLSKVVSQSEWLAARKKFLKKEKEFSRLRDELSRERRELPWEEVEKPYVFDGPKGEETLADLFAGRSQLIVYHFMFGPGWKEGCPSCSYLADHFDGAALHLAHRDTTLAVISRATLPEIEAFKKRMGWRFKWVSSAGNSFNFDYHVSFSKEEKAQGKVLYNYGMMDFPSEEAPGASVFYKNEAGEIFHTYSSYARGLDILIGTYNFLDLTPKGRDEDGLPHSMAWVRHHDKYSEGFLPIANIAGTEKKRG